MDEIKYLNGFKEDISKIEIPTKFTYPFYYSPADLTLIAVQQTQDFLKKQIFKHNFGLDKTNSNPIIGKMFGILVTRTAKGKLGFLVAHSGELQDNKDFNMFVPSVVNNTSLEYNKSNSKLAVEKINNDILKINNDENYQELKKQYSILRLKNQALLDQFKLKSKKAKHLRNQRRQSLDKTIDNSKELENLIKESLHYKYQLKVISESNLNEEKNIYKRLEFYLQDLKDLELNRKNILIELQKFELNQYNFLNSKNETLSLFKIFNKYANFKPPAGAGNCSAPKLLQYAYKNNLQPIAMAEFWWGSPHKSEIKRHKNFYPACTSRCKPILAHMLQGLNLEENELLVNHAHDYKIKTIFEDDYLLIINKPHGLLSVPGKEIKDSVANRMKTIYPKATGPLVVHRLDQETSGIMIIAKEENIYKLIQKQFIERSIKKKYIAVLSEELISLCGVIELPLRGDFNNRPYQLICFENGKKAITKYKTIRKSDNQTRVEFEPITGRTHQLRLHAAHFRGLNAPIIGDTLYGKRSNRLMLHASWIKFLHPITKKTIEIESTPDF